MMTDQNTEQEAASSNDPWPHLASLVVPKSKKRQQLHDEALAVTPENTEISVLKTPLHPPVTFK